MQFKIYQKFNLDIDSDEYESFTDQQKYETVFNWLPEYAQDDFIEFLMCCEKSLPKMPHEVLLATRLTTLTFFARGFLSAKSIH